MGGVPWRVALDESGQFVELDALEQVALLTILRDALRQLEDDVALAVSLEKDDLVDLGIVQVEGDLLLLDADELDAIVVDGEDRLDAVWPDATVVSKYLRAPVERELRDDRQVLPHRLCRRLALAVALKMTRTTLHLSARLLLQDLTSRCNLKVHLCIYQVYPLLRTGRKLSTSTIDKK